VVLEKNAKEILNELRQLNLMDRFLFAEATEDPEVVEIILEIVLGREIVLKHQPQAEKEIRKAVWSKIVRLDVMAIAEDDAVFNAEVQQKNTGDLPRRSRFYNGMIDSKLLPSGSVNYNELSDVFIITIMSFDLFGEGRYRYTFEMTCEESQELKLKDGATRIFLNTKGKNPDEVSQDILDLLAFFEDSTYETAKALNNEKIWKLYEKIDAIKKSEEIGVKWMNAWEERIYMEREARAQGLAEGRLDTMVESIKNLMESMELTQGQAMDALKIPEENREECVDRLK